MCVQPQSGLEPRASLQRVFLTFFAFKSQVRPLHHLKQAVKAILFILYASISQLTIQKKQFLKRLKFVDRISPFSEMFRGMTYKIVTYNSSFKRRETIVRNKWVNVNGSSVQEANEIERPRLDAFGRVLWKTESRWFELLRHHAFRR